MRTARTIATATLLLALLVACSGGEDVPADAGGADRTTSAPDQRATGDAFACPDGVGTISVSAVSAEEASAIEGANASQYEGRIGIDAEGVTLSDGAGLLLDGGTALTLYLADHSLEHDSLFAAPPRAEAGELIVSLIAASYRSPEAPAPELDPVAAGEVIMPSQGAADIDSGERVFTVTVDNGGARHDETIEALGSLEIVYLDDDEACVDIDFTSLVAGTEDGTQESARRVSGVVRVDLVRSS